MKRRELENSPKKKKLDEGSPDENAEETHVIEEGSKPCLQHVV